MITNDIPNGTILLASVLNSSVQEPMIVVSSNGLGHWGYSITYGSCWLNPTDLCHVDWLGVKLFSKEIIFKAKLKLHDLHDKRFLSNLDYIEALAKLKEYEI